MRRAPTTVSSSLASAAKPSRVSVTARCRSGYRSSQARKPWRSRTLVSAPGGISPRLRCGSQPRDGLADLGIGRLAELAPLGAGALDEHHLPVPAGRSGALGQAVAVAALGAGDEAARRVEGFGIGYPPAGRAGARLVGPTLEQVPGRAGEDCLGPLALLAAQEGQEAVGELALRGAAGGAVADGDAERVGERGRLPVRHDGGVCPAQGVERPARRAPRRPSPARRAREGRASCAFLRQPTGSGPWRAPGARPEARRAGSCRRRRTDRGRRDGSCSNASEAASRTAALTAPVLRAHHRNVLSGGRWTSRLRLSRRAASETATGSTRRGRSARPRGAPSWSPAVARPSSS